jgi:SAM-dependent methyltransferase
MMRLLCLEDGSFWFAHRNACLLALLRQFPAIGPFFDIGGGNGFVAAALQSEGGLPVVLVEPGADGVRHAQARGLHTVVQATLKEARFRDGSLPAIGFFDVMEHIDDEQGFLCEIRRCLRLMGASTSPCRRDAGYGRMPMCRRDTSVATRCQLAAGFGARGFPASVYEQDIFPAAPAIVPVPVPAESFWPSAAACPELLRQHRPRGQSLMEGVWHWELARLARGRSIPCGTSCLAVAELSSYKSKEFSNVNQ